jgi:polysulfide reductase chain C
MADKLERQVQTVWGWAIAVHLFLAGAGAGSYAIGVLAGYLGADWAGVARTGVLLGFPLLALDTILLVRDLGVRSHALRVFSHPGTSWIARGSWIISVVMTIAFVHLVSVMRPDLGIAPGLVGALSTVGLVGAVLIMVYTGALLTASRAIGLWNSALLPLLFVVAATSTGIAANLLLAPADGSALAAVAALARADVVLIVLELAIIAFFIQSAHRTDESRASAHLLVKGRLAATFWLGLIALGLALPLVLNLVTIAGAGAGADAVWTTKTAAVARIFGAVLLPRLILAAGVRTPLRAGGMDFTFPQRYKATEVVR